MNRKFLGVFGTLAAFMGVVASSLNSVNPTKPEAVWAWWLASSFVVIGGIISFVVPEDRAGEPPKMVPRSTQYLAWGASILYLVGSFIAAAVFSAYVAAQVTPASPPPHPEESAPPPAPQPAAPHPNPDPNLPHDEPIPTPTDSTSKH